MQIHRILQILSTAHLLLPLYHCKKSRTTPSPGAWGEWEEWDAQCSTTCGVGFRRRTRPCSYAGRDRKLKCKGKAGEIKNCDTQLTCPMNGGWSSWMTSGACSASCGGGRGLRRRSCTRPKPMFGGKDCQGLSEEMGECNAGMCADQVYTLSPEASRKMEKSLEMFHNFQPDEGTSITLPCDPDALSAVLSLYPASSVIFWTLNGRTLQLDVRRTRVSPTELRLVSARPADSGVYACRVRYGEENETAAGRPGRDVGMVTRAVSVAAVAVRPSSPTATPTEGREEGLRLRCLGEALWELRRGGEDLRQSWWLGRKVFKEFEIGSVEEFLVEEVTQNLTGIWTCQVKDLKRGWTWTTNQVKVRVLPEPPPYQTLLKNPVFWLGLASLIFLVLVSIGTMFSYRAAKAREAYGQDFQKWLHVLEDMGDEEESDEDKQLL